LPAWVPAAARGTDPIARRQVPHGDRRDLDDPLGPPGDDRAGGAPPAFDLRHFDLRLFPLLGAPALPGRPASDRPRLLRAGLDFRTGPAAGRGAGRDAGGSRGALPGSRLAVA